MNVAIVTVHMKMGGIRQSLLNLLDYVEELDWDVDLFVFSGDEDDVRRALGSRNVNKIYIIKNMDIFSQTLSAQKSFSNKVKKVCYGTSCRFLGRERVVLNIIKHEYRPEKHYDIAISYANGIWTGGSRNFSGGCEAYVINNIKADTKAAWIHSNPEKLGFTTDIGNRVYSSFDKIINVSYGCKVIFDRICPNLSDKSFVFYNLVDSAKVLRRCEEFVPYDGASKFIIVTVARLDNKSKRLDVIAQCCKKLADEKKNFEWHIVGDGNDRGMLEFLIKELDIGRFLIMEGSKENPYPYMKCATIYVCTSGYEAFPLVVRECQTTGTPVITTPIPAAKELITDGEDGVISGFDIESLCSDILKLMTDNKKVENMRSYMKKNKSKYDDSIEELKGIFGLKQKA